MDTRAGGRTPADRPPHQYRPRDQASPRQAVSRVAASTHTATWTPAGGGDCRVHRRTQCAGRRPVGIDRPPGAGIGCPAPACGFRRRLGPMDGEGVRPAGRDSQRRIRSPSRDGPTSRQAERISASAPTADWSWPSSQSRCIVLRPTSCSRRWRTALGRPGLASCSPAWAMTALRDCWRYVAKAASPSPKTRRPRRCSGCPRLPSVSVR